MLTLTSKDNSNIKNTVKLKKSARYRRQSGLFIAEGLRVCYDAMLSNAEIQILFATEKAMRKAIESLSYNPTVFIVSQRTSSIMHADKIIVLEDGSIVGNGTHEELLEGCDVYKEIYYSQFKKEGE